MTISYIYGNDQVYYIVHSDGSTEVSPGYLLVGSKDGAFSPCPKCGALHPILERDDHFRKDHAGGIALFEECKKCGYQWILHSSNTHQALSESGLTWSDGGRPCWICPTCHRVNVITRRPNYKDRPIHWQKCGKSNGAWKCAGKWVPSPKEQEALLKYFSSTIGRKRGRPMRSQTTL